MVKTIMIQGTASSVGKSVIVTALCRIFLQAGYKVCPFKAQNMSLNSFVTKEGTEMGRAQVVQAQAARLEPHVDMNPILIKPTSDVGAQIILQGKPVGNMQVEEYKNYKKEAIKTVVESFNRLKKEYEIIVIEGAGSPAEINLREEDLVNMKMAEIANAGVILVGDIDKGGVFASFVGTLELLEKKECRRIKGFMINKFRGEKSLLEKGISFLEKKTKKPVLGVIPYFKDIRIPQEDSVILEQRAKGREQGENKRNVINIVVIRLPHISNFTDFDVLENEPDVRLSYISETDKFDHPDVLILPGTKNTIQDLIWLRKSGLEEKILSTINYKLSTVLVGICGGYQMLGKLICDPDQVESTQKEIQGLGLFPLVTYFKPEKILSQIEAIQISSGLEIKGYEIHHGRTLALEPITAMFKLKGEERLEGAQIKDGRIWGSYLHGVFDSYRFRRNFLNQIRLKKGLKALPLSENAYNLEDQFNKLASLVRENIDMELLYKILNHKL